MIIHKNSNTLYSGNEGKQMQDIVAKIQATKLTKADVQIADYFLDHINTIGLQTSTDLANAIQVSDSSIIRFIRKLGFSGYAEFRNEMKARMAEQYDTFQQETSLMPSEKFEITKERLTQSNLITDVCSYVLTNIEKTISSLNLEKIDMVSRVLLNSNRKFIAGFRGTSCCATYMANRLTLLLPNVTAIIHADASAVETIYDISPNDCLLLYSFPRYSKVAFNLMDIAKNRQARIILVTDRYTSPLASYADAVIATSVNGLGFTNSYVAPMSISEVILLSISSSAKNNCSDRIRGIDALMEQTELY